MIPPVRVVTAAVIIENGRLLLAQRAPEDYLAGMWELPGGKVEAGETLQDCLERELREELEMDCTVGDVLATTTYHYEHGSFEMVALEVKRLSDYVPRAHSDVQWTSQEDAASLTLAPADVALVRAVAALGGWT